MLLPRERLKAIVPHGNLDFNIWPLQLGMGGCPWRITVASILMCRCRRTTSDVILRRLLHSYPTAGHLARAVDLETIVRPCGLQVQRARQLTRMSAVWLGDAWNDARDLPGVGVYVADALGLFLFGCTELESKDKALQEYACRLYLS